MVVSGTKVGAGSDTLTEEAVTKRIAPVAGFALVDANAPKVFKTGEQVFAAVYGRQRGLGAVHQVRLRHDAERGPARQGRHARQGRQPHAVRL
ncbi:hypothetical protein G6F57_022811 [Rhizopus arrhizus]|nr:hypothetical protein G6F57_022811 [Rhizopus arrhizus]